MKAAVYYETGGPEVFKYEDVPDPQCHPRGIIIDVEAVSIEGGDVLNRAGGALRTHPHVVGYQAAGTICEVGSDVRDRQGGSARGHLRGRRIARRQALGARACILAGARQSLHRRSCLHTRDLRHRG